MCLAEIGKNIAAEFCNQAAGQVQLRNNVTQEQWRERVMANIIQKVAANPHSLMDMNQSTKEKLITYNNAVGNLVNTHVDELFALGA